VGVVAQAPTPTPAPTPQIEIGTAMRVGSNPILLDGRRVGSLLVSREDDSVRVVARFDHSPGRKRARLCVHATSLDRCTSRRIVVRRDLVLVATAPFAQHVTGRVSAGAARGTVTA
jgi:hypothetical protein